MRSSWITNYSTAHHWYAEYLGFQGRFDEALIEIERARQLDPLSLIIATDRGAILHFARQHDRAIEQFRAVLDIEPTFPRAPGLIVGAYTEKAQFDEALDGIEKWRRWDKGPWPWAWAAYVHGRAGRPADARRALQKMEESNRQSKFAPAPLLLTAYPAMAKHDEALALLQKGLAERSHLLATLKVDPLYDPLRGDPRFVELMRRIGLAP